MAEIHPTPRGDARDGRRGSRGGRGDDSAVGRVPPQDLDAEKSVLSSILLDNGCLNEVYPELKPEDFYHPAHRQLFSSMIALHDESQPIDLLTLSAWLTDRKLLDVVGGTGLLA